MRLRASIKTPRPQDVAGTAVTGCEIAQGNGGFFLFGLDHSGASIVDTWHERLEDAKAQAEFDYGVREEDWRPLPT